MNRWADQNKRALAESLEPRRLLTAFVVTSTDDAGEGTLHQAILDANSSEGADRIEFSLGTGGVARINIINSLPLVTDTLTVDGTTQPGFAGGPLVEITGPAKSGPFADRVYGFDVAAPDCVIQAVSMFGFENQIRLKSQRGIVRGCWLGLNAAGEKPLFSNPQYYGTGIWVTKESSDNLIGGDVASARNVVSGNTASGMVVDGVRNVVAGNYVGLDPTGTATRGNYGVGIFASGSHNLIGGTTAAARNVIGANALGIAIESGSANSYNTVQGNYIGTDHTGTQPIGNKIAIQIRGTYNVIGGAGPAGNLIAYQTQATIIIRKPVLPLLPSHGNRIFGNSIYENAGMAIDIEEDVVITNDTLDADTGGNERQNHPVITLARSDDAGSQIKGTLHSKPETQFTVHLYSTPPYSVDRQGKTPVGVLTVTTDAAGNAGFDAVVARLPRGHRVTATATDPDGNTSEFSPGLANTAPIVPPRVVSWMFDHSTAPDRFIVRFSELVSPITTQSLFFSESSSYFIPQSAQYDPATHTATFTLGNMNDAVYRAMLAVPEIRDIDGDQLASVPSMHFHILEGDVDRDQQVSFTDLLTVSANFGKAPAVFANGDLDSSGAVGFNDLLLVASRFGRKVPSAPMSAALSTKPVFLDKPLIAPRPAQSKLLSASDNSPVAAETLCARCIATSHYASRNSSIIMHLR